MCGSWKSRTHRSRRLSVSATATYKVYSTFSGRRFTTDLKEAHEKGHTARNQGLQGKAVLGRRLDSFHNGCHS